MHEVIAKFSAFLHTKYTSHQTVKTYLSVATAFEQWRSAHQETRVCRSVIAFLARPLATGVSRAPATRNRELMALRVYFAFGESMLGWSDEQLKTIAVSREPKRHPPVVSRGEIHAIIRELAADPNELTRSRNLAIVGLLTLTGLRIHEAMGLNINQVDLDSQTLLAVKCKTGSIYDVVVSDGLATLLKQWLDLSQARCSSTDGALFIVPRRGTRLSIRAVQALIARTRTKLSIKRRVSPHSFRHAFATQALEAGADISIVSSLLHHSNLSTTLLYLKFGTAAKRKVVEALSGLIPPEFTSDSPPSPKISSLRNISDDPPCAESLFCDPAAP
jgi:site-specific recombinase XerD